MIGGPATGRRGPGCLTFLASGTEQTWSSFPNLPGPICGISRRIPVDLTRLRQFRVVATVVTACPDAYLRARYGSTAIDAFANLGSGGDLAISSTGIRAGDWTDIVVGARGARYVALNGGGSDGSGVAGLVYAAIELR